MAKSIAELANPFSIFSPGLAGVSRREQFVSDGVLLRALARGDANLFLRNILYRLSESGKFDAFMADLNTIFPTLQLRVEFNNSYDESIRAEVKTSEEWVPLELAGTSILQATQILSYIHRFSPSVVVLDEPDSHLHPNNQRLLCRLLRQIAEERETQIILTSHSRHVVDALSGAANFLWVRNNSVETAGPEDNIGILLDLGALDIKERVGVADTKAIVLTEDDDCSGLEILLEASGFRMEEVVVLSYHGVTTIKNLRPLVEIARGQRPDIPIVLHRDRDFLSDDEVERWNELVRNLRVDPFVTTGTDVESHFVCSQHLADTNAEEDVQGFSMMIDDVLAELTPKLIEEYVNGKLQIARNSPNGERRNPGTLAAEAHGAIAEAKNQKGKTLLRGLRKAFRDKHNRNLKTIAVSASLSVEQLKTIATRIFGDV